MLARGPRRVTAPALLALLLVAADGAARPPRGGDDGPRGRGPRDAPAPVTELAPLPLPMAPTGGPRKSAAAHILVRFADAVPAAERPARAALLGGGRYRPARFATFARVEVPARVEVAALVARFAASPDVLWAETDGYARGLGRPVLPATAAAVAFDDPQLPRQWTFARINLLAAFERNPHRGAGVVVAVLDTGVAYGDGAGYPTRRGVDLADTAFVPGWDFVDDDAQPYDLGYGLDERDRMGSTRFGHGTFVASLIAAAAGNGVAGIGAAPRAAIMPLRVLGVDNFALFSDIADALAFAVEHGAHVANMSLGAARGSRALAEAVAAADAAGVLLVAAAGNQDGDPALEGDVVFPARYPQVLAVGATDFDDRRAGYSATGPGLDLVAPAGDSAREVAPGILDAALATSFTHDPRAGTSDYRSYWALGTSFAAPQVAATAALLRSLGVTSTEALRLLLVDHAHDLAPRGFDLDTGGGRLDAKEAHLGLGLTE